MTESVAEWQHIAQLPTSDTAPRLVLADYWQEQGQTEQAIALRQLCHVLDGANPLTVTAKPTALHQAALMLFPPSKRLNRLNDAQIRMIPVWRDACLRTGLATGDVDEAQATEAVHQCYRCAGLQAPSKTIWIDSPLQGVTAAYQLSQVWAHVGDHVYQVGAQVRAQVWDQAWAQVRAQVGAQVGDQVWDQAWDQVRAQVGAQVWDQVRAQVGAQVRAQVWDQVWAQVRAQVGAQVGDQVWDQVHNACFGLHDSSWLSFYSYIHHIGGVRVCDRLQGLWIAAESVGWFWPLHDTVIITRRPTELLMNEGTLVRVRYRDGFEVYGGDNGNRRSE